MSVITLSQQRQKISIRAGRRYAGLYVLLHRLLAAVDPGNDDKKGKSDKGNSPNIRAMKIHRYQTRMMRHDRLNA